jgi:phage terminase small subunit
MSKINIVVAAQTGGAIKGLNDVTAATRRTGAAVKKAQVGMRNFSGEVSKSQIVTRKFAMGGLQQAGYQIGDYAVQVANGTSKMQAFGQQAPQLLQIFGPIGAVLGAATAIFAAFGVAAQKAAEASGNAETAVEDLNAAFNTLKQVDFDSLGEDMSSPAKMVLSEYAGVLEMINKVAEEQRAQAIGNVLDKFAPQAEIEAVMAQMRSIQNEMNALPENVEPTEATVFELNEINERLMDMQRLKEIMNGLDARSREEAAKKLEAVRETLLSEGLMTPELRRQLSAYADQFGLVSSITAQLKAASDETKKIVVAAQPLPNILSAAAQSALLLSQRLAAAPAFLQNMKNQAAVMRSEVLAISSGFGQAAASSAAFRKERELHYNLENISHYEQRKFAQERIDDEVRQFEANQKLTSSLTNLRSTFTEVGSSGGAAMTKIKDKTQELSLAIQPVQEKMKGIANTIEGSMEGAFMSVVDGTKTVGEAFRSMAVEIIKELYRVFVVKRITGFITNAINGYFNMNQVSGPSMPFGTGSVRPMARPSFSGGGYTGDGARAGGLDGKGGFMAMMHPRETVVDHTRGQSSGGVTVIQNNTFGSGVSRAEVNAMLPKMVEATKSAVADAKLRGGSYGGAFA